MCLNGKSIKVNGWFSSTPRLVSKGSLVSSALSCPPAQCSSARSYFPAFCSNDAHFTCNKARANGPWRFTNCGNCCVMNDPSRYRKKNLHKDLSLWVKFWGRNHFFEAGFKVDHNLSLIIFNVVSWLVARFAIVARISELFWTEHMY